MTGIPALLALLYGWAIKVATWIQPVFLLLIRLYIGWEFFQSGMGKLMHIPKITDYFHSLGIPFPAFNAYLSGSTECFGGLFLLVGLASRIITIPLIITMIVAYLTASPDAVKGFFHDSDPFFQDAAFPFLLTSVIVFLFGPGILSVDGAIGLYLKKRAAKEAVAKTTWVA